LGALVCTSCGIIQATAARSSSTSPPSTTREARSPRLLPRPQQLRLRLPRPEARRERRGKGRAGEGRSVERMGRQAEA
jgi:hypothetical protein